MPRRTNKTVLIIDDNSDWRFLIKDLLRGLEGVELIEAHTVTDGIDAILAVPVDFVILDRRFGLMNGSSKKAEEFMNSQGIPFVYLTGSVRTNGEVYSDNVWSKDMPLPELRQMIAQRVMQTEDHSHWC